MAVGQDGATRFQLFWAHLGFTIFRLHHIMDRIHPVFKRYCPDRWALKGDFSLIVDGYPNIDGGA